LPESKVAGTLIDETGVAEDGSVSGIAYLRLTGRVPQIAD